MTKIERRPKRNRESHNFQLSHREASKPAENGKANTAASGLKVLGLLAQSTIDLVLTTPYYGILLVPSRHHPSGAVALSFLVCHFTSTCRIRTVVVSPSRPPRWQVSSCSSNKHGQRCFTRSILHSSRRLTLLYIDNPGTAVPFFSNKCCSIERADKQLPSLSLSDRKDHTLSHRACLSPYSPPVRRNRRRVFPIQEPRLQ
ncbi:uncharacterized protein BO88DRAFT_28812 [Aspergillus vadensis CBS 113365]|uniref:Uncharacterized protein n=1 Tax=Aspergillus vadensis (strain CBS 113365 / IMI 142717 / IBT 24658) TaxID=1448311 RepID=A0A319BR72_ASPVC|nr:hypothetical protein BO88DRAFT_28812 [Aspergillus vadensis CBS 113365]PYH74967.1 hypothetical protein BO88DRAFT_28812 [Aspergillus vadensis CBS 113365]